MKSNVILTLFVIFWSNFATSQSPFDKVIDRLSYNQKIPLSIFADSNYFFYIGNGYGNPPSFSIVQDYMGNILKFTDTIGKDVNPEPAVFDSPFLKIKDNEFIFISKANRFEHDYYIYSYAPLQDELKIKNRLFRFSEYLDFGQIKKYNDDEFLLLEYINPGSQAYTIFTILDSNFQILKETYLYDSLNSSFTPTYFEILENKNTLVIGELYENKTNGRTGWIFLREYDKDIHLVNSKLLNIGKNLRLSRGSLLKDQKGNYIITAEAYFLEPGSLYYDSESLVLAINSNFDQILWLRKLSKEFGKKDDRFYNESLIKSIQNDNFWALGNIAPGLFAPRHNSYIYKFNSIGDSIWLKTYKTIQFDTNEIATQSFTDASATIHNSLLVSGFVMDTLSKTSHPWILHLDEDGCLVPGCNINTNTTAIENSNSKFFQIYPQPVRSDQFYLLSRITVKSDCKLIISDLQGRQLKETNMRPEKGTQYVIRLPIEISSGEYIISIIGDHFQQTEKLIISR